MRARPFEVTFVHRLLLLNGPNLNLLGTREPDRYGSRTLPDIVADLRAEATGLGHELLDFQSNHEGALIDRIHQAHAERVEFLLMNPGGYTHTSIALRDAILAVGIPLIEIHLSNVHAREPFRHHSFFSDIAAGVIVGLGAVGYRLALLAALDKLNHAA